MLGFAFSLRYLSPFQALFCALGACAFNLCCLPRIGSRRIFRQSENRPFWSGPFYYSLSILVLILIFSRYLHIVAAAWAVMALGDGTASLGGKRSQRYPIPWNPRKSILGSLRFIVFGTLGAVSLLLWTLRPSPEVQFSLAEVITICISVTICCAVVESLPWKLDDNLSVPLAAGVLFFLLLNTSLLNVLRSEDFSRALVSASLINLILACVAWLLGWITVSGAIAGIFLGTSVFVSLGAKGLSLLLIFLILGSLSTKLGYRSKRRLGMSQSHRGARGAKEALANGFLPALLAIFASVTANGDLFLVGFVSALAAATADTVSSEIGQWLGGEPFLITNFARVRPGTNGAITGTGTLFGILAACLLSLLALRLRMISQTQFWIVQVAGLVGNLTDSLLGASVEREDGIDNETVNFLNTLAGAGTGMALESWIHHRLLG
jgi:uncharacterized protein (TIGR00297 family)